MMSGPSALRNSAVDRKLVHAGIVAEVRRDMPRVEALFEAADFFRVFGDSTRIGILFALSKSELCGGDLCALLDMTPSAVSHQLRLLTQARLVRRRREGRNIYFRLADEHVSAVLKLGMIHVTA
jgi:ArsR family transcriptional regulator